MKNTFTLLVTNAKKEPSGKVVVEYEEAFGVEDMLLSAIEKVRGKEEQLMIIPMSIFTELSLKAFEN